jgi:hypothetical protein
MPVCLLCLIACTLPAFAADIQITADPPLPVANILANPGFEDGADAQPAAWKFGTASPDNFVTGWAAEGRTGKAVCCKALSASMSGYWGQGVTLQPDTDYRLTGWFRLRGGKLLVYVHAPPPTLNERFYATSMLNHFLVPVFLKPEYMRGAPDTWQPLKMEFRTPAGLAAASVSLGMYFTAGEVWYDDFSLHVAKTTLKLKVTDTEDLRSVQVKTAAGEVVYDSGVLAAGTRALEHDCPGVSTEGSYVVVATGASGKTSTKQYPAGGDAQ